MINVNLTGTFLGMKGEIPMMLKQGAGVTVNIASVAGVSRFRRHTNLGSFKTRYGRIN